MAPENQISINGFVHESVTRIQRAAAKIFPSESGYSVTITNTLHEFDAELCVVATDGSRYTALFDFSVLAAATNSEQSEQSWENVIRAAWDKSKRAKRSRDMLSPMTDRTTKLLLLVIALGLWANVSIGLLRQQRASAQDSTLSNIDTSLIQIGHDVHSLADIEDGTCRNSKICH